MNDVSASFFQLDHSVCSSSSDIDTTEVLRISMLSLRSEDVAIR